MPGFLAFKSQLALAGWRRKLVDQPGDKLQDQRRIDCVDRSVLIYVRAWRVRQARDQVRVELQHEQRIDTTHSTVVVHVAQRLGGR